MTHYINQPTFPPTQILDTSEQAAMTVRYLQSSPFPRYGPSPLQVTFSLPNIAGKVLLKSFQTFYEQVTFLKLRRLHTPLVTYFA